MGWNRRTAEQALAIVAFASVMLATSPARADAELVVEHRIPAGFLAVFPGDRAPLVTGPELYALLKNQLAKKTQLKLEAIDDELVAACNAELSCVLRVVERRVEETDTRLRYLFLFANLARSGRGDRISITLFDTTVPKDAPPVASRELREVRSSSQAAALISEFLEADLRPKLDVFASLGDIELRGAPAGAAIHIEGRLIGSTHESTTIVRGVPVGRRRLEVAAEGRSPVQLDIDVRAEETTRLEVSLPRAKDETGRLAMRYGGAGILLVGSAMLALPAFGGSHVSCIERQNEGACASMRMPDFGLDGRENGSIVPALGAGLVAMGASFVIASFFEDAPGSLPAWLIGGAVGGAAFGLTFALTRPDAMN